MRPPIEGQRASFKNLFAKPFAQVATLNRFVCETQYRSLRNVEGRRSIIIRTKDARCLKVRHVGADRNSGDRTNTDITAKLSN